MDKKDRPKQRRTNYSYLIIKCILAALILLMLSILSFWDQHIIKQQMTPSIAEKTSTDISDSPLAISNSYMDEFLHLDADTLVLAIGTTGNLSDGGYEPIYSSPDTTSNELAELQFNCAVVIDISQLKDQTNYAWLPVLISSTNHLGYVQKSNIEIVPLSTFNVTDNNTRNQILQDSISYLGLKFVRYGKSLEDGIDCSNFIQQIYEKSNVSIADTPNDILAQSRIIDEADALPGDIVYYDCNNGGGHTAIYLGEGLVIGSTGHSGREYPEGGVRICRLKYLDREIYEFCRIIN